MVPAPLQPRWLAYGDAITQGWLASAPAMAWPAVAGRKLGLDVCNLGYAGTARGETTSAVLLAETPAEVVSIAFGLNNWSRVPHTTGLMAEEVRCFLSVVRRGHPEVPIVVVSPTARPDAEDTPNRVGATLAELRLSMEETVLDCIADGDKMLFLVEGLTAVGPEDLEDGIYPGDEGHRRLAAAVSRFSFPTWLTSMRRRRRGGPTRVSSLTFPVDWPAVRRIPALESGHVSGPPPTHDGDGVYDGDLCPPERGRRGRPREEQASKQAQGAGGFRLVADSCDSDRRRIRHRRSLQKSRIKPRISICPTSIRWTARSLVNQRSSRHPLAPGSPAGPVRTERSRHVIEQFVMWMMVTAIPVSVSDLSNRRTVDDRLGLPSGRRTCFRLTPAPVDPGAPLDRGHTWLKPRDPHCPLPSSMRSPSIESFESASVDEPLAHSPSTWHRSPGVDWNRARRDGTDHHSIRTDLPGRTPCPVAMVAQPATVPIEMATPPSTWRHWSRSPSRWR